MNKKIKKRDTFMIKISCKNKENIKSTINFPCIEWSIINLWLTKFIQNKFIIFIFAHIRSYEPALLKPTTCASDVGSGFPKLKSGWQTLSEWTQSSPAVSISLSSGLFILFRSTDWYANLRSSLISILFARPLLLKIFIFFFAFCRSLNSSSLSFLRISFQ